MRSFEESICGLQPQSETPGSPDDLHTFDVPIVLLVFNRPALTTRVFEAVRRWRPDTLLVICDGPREGKAGEREKVAEVRAIVEDVDWPCEVHRNYSDRNLGCRDRVSSGLTWAFGIVDRAVILEDDCLPCDAFFGYCREMLERYRNEPRIFAASGSNFSGVSGVDGHYFSQYPLMWGWATWRDRWEKYDLEPEDYMRVLLKKWWSRPLQLLYWLLVARSVAMGRVNTWDIQWIITVWRNGGLCCRPSSNLVANIGFGHDATHTTMTYGRISDLPVLERPADFARLLGQPAGDSFRDRIDEDVWARSGMRTVLLMIWRELARILGRGG